MEKFIGKVRNPYYRDRLSTTLQGGKRVFPSVQGRAFRTGQPASGLVWFKQHEMEKVVTALVP
jgi:hypothetical protein